jgi:hydrogenase nickel incorporation protein HypA/HybF
MVRRVHELSICISLAAIVTEHAAGRPVDRVVIDVGSLRQVVPETLRYSWEIVVADTPLAGSTLDINHVPVVLACRDCGASTAIEAPLFRCGTCGSTDVEIVSGQELLLRSLELSGV